MLLISIDMPKRLSPYPEPKTLKKKQNLKEDITPEIIKMEHPAND